MRSLPQTDHGDTNVVMMMMMMNNAAASSYDDDDKNDFDYSLFEDAATCDECDNNHPNDRVTRCTTDNSYT